MVHLISMPWPYYTMPSIQISALKAYLLDNNVPVKGSHLHLEVANWLGYSNYSAITHDFLEDGESLYGYLLFPEIREQFLLSSPLNEKKLTIRNGELQFPSKDFFFEFDKFHDEWLNQFNWEEHSLVGFTLNFGQTAPSLYMAKKIKERNPLIKIIFGGAEASGKLGLSLLQNFPQVDFVCNGEGEQPLLNLWKARLVGDGIHGITTRTQKKDQILTNQLKDLIVLPAPNFEDYFNVINEKLGGDIGICTTIPIESSRGCYFDCSFCALNLQWDNFRVIPKEKVVESITRLTEAYKVLDIFFVDNITPTKVNQLCDAIINTGLSIRAFYETRANLPAEHFRMLRKAGVVKVQLGIESFSSRLLERFNKRNKAIYNLQGLKNCYIYDITVVGNIISDYPYASREDIDENIRFISYAMAYPPSLSFSTFALEVGSPDYDNHLVKRIYVKGNYSLYKRIYPDYLLKKLDLPRKEFDLDESFDHQSWDDVQVALDKWSESYFSMKEKYGYGTRPLVFMDGGSFLLFEDYRYGKKRLYQFDNPGEKEIYEAANQVISIRKLATKFEEKLNGSEIESIINRFEKFKLMAREDDLVLSLAVPYHQNSIT